MHITLNVLGYAAFALSFVLSAIYLVQNSLLRAIAWEDRVALSALESLEKMSRSSVIVGLVSLVVGIGFGYLWVNRILWPLLERRSQGDHHRGDPGVYAGYLWLGRTGSWRGARASVLCVVNFLFVLFSYSESVSLVSPVLLMRAPIGHKGIGHQGD